MIKVRTRPLMPKEWPTVYSGTILSLYSALKRCSLIAAMAVWLDDSALVSINRLLHVEPIVSAEMGDRSRVLVCNQPPRPTQATQPPILSGMRNEYQPREAAVLVLAWEVTVGPSSGVALTIYQRLCMWYIHLHCLNGLRRGDKHHRHVPL